MGKIGPFGTILSVLTVALSCYFYYISEPFTFLNHWVSNLGVGTTITANLFNIGLSVSGIFFFLFNVVFCKWFSPVRKWDRRFLTIATVFNVISVIGIFILTANDMIENLPIHSIGSYMFFTGAATYTTLVCIVLGRNRRASPLEYLVSITLLVVFLIITPLIFLVIPQSEWSTALGNMSSDLNAARGFEWSALMLFYLWLIQTSLLVKHQSAS